MSVRFRKDKGKKSGAWIFDIQVDGKRIRRALGSKAEALNAEAVLKAEVAQGKKHLLYNFTNTTKVGFPELISKYLEWARQHKRSWVRDEFMIQNLKEHFGGMLLRDIKPLDVQEYTTKRLQSVKGSTVNREISCLKHMLNLACEWEMLSENPLRKMRRLQEQQKEIRILTHDEIKRLLEASCSHLRAMIIIALNTGMRLGEILGLSWSAVDFAQGHITLWKTKNSKPRHIPMNIEVRKVLEGLRNGSDLVFPSKRLNGPRAYVKTAWWAALERAGIEDFTFHGIRHHAATMMVLGGIDLVTVKEILGHSNIQMTMRYAHPTPESKVRAVEVLAKAFRGEPVENGPKKAHRPDETVNPPRESEISQRPS